jgi:hypothetical protein
MSTSTKLPKTPLSRLKALALRAEAPMILLHWLDACFDSTERVSGRKLPKGYQSGCIDVICGYFVGICDECVVMSHSAYVRKGRPTNYRHLWNIPIGMIVKVEVLEVKKGRKRGT